MSPVYLQDGDRDPYKPLGDDAQVWRVFFSDPVRGWVPVLSVARHEQGAIKAARARYPGEFEKCRATLVQKIERA